jgi:signal transduction histidine kinase
VDPAQLPRLEPDACLTAVDGRVLYVTQWIDAIPPTTTEPARVARLLIDVTAETRRAERLQDARRLEQLGTLVAMMMPDMQALVSSVRQAGRNLLTVTDAAEAAEHLRNLEAQISEADGLVTQLAAFSRRQVRPRDRLSLNEGVERVAPTLRGLTGSDVTLELALGAAATVVTSQDDLERLLTSLVIAARDLLPSGGRVTISTHRPDPLDRLEFGDEPAVLRPVRLCITAEGYQVEPFSPTAALERVVARCDGVLHVREPGGRRVSVDIDLPTACPTRRL